MTALQTSGRAMGLVAALLCGVGQAAAQEDGLLNPLRALEKATLKGFLERPLFDPSRRLPLVTPPPVVVRSPVSSEPPPMLHLLGVIHGSRDMALVRRDGATKTTILRTGDRVGSWTVTVAPPFGVRLSDKTRAFDYVLFTRGAPRAVGVRPVGPITTGQTDALGLPLTAPDSAWHISPD